MPIYTIEGSVLLITPAASANQNITFKYSVYGPQAKA